MGDKSWQEICSSDQVCDTRGKLFQSTAFLYLWLHQTDFWFYMVKADLLKLLIM